MRAVNSELDHFNELVNPVIWLTDLTDLFFNKTQVQLADSMIFL